MVGETWDKWRETVRKTIELVARQRDDLSDGAAVQHGLLQGHPGQPHRNAGRRLADEARLGRITPSTNSLAAGYRVSSAYTMVKDIREVNFSYRDNLWRGSDLLATGVASFGHISGVHYQNQHRVGRLLGTLEAGELPLAARPASHAASVAGPRDDPAAQDRLSRRRLFPPQVRRRDSSRLARSGTNTSPKATPRSTATSIELDARRPAARRCACCRPSSSPNTRA